ncbi:hypothetical protein CLM82_30230 [Streptomyces albidoflavus]|nr:hypothetical protein CLM82_30230 [Streptomyces albidoflavus]
MVLPEEDKYSTTRNEMLDQLASMLPGRAAEELVCQAPPTGPAHAMQTAHRHARGSALPRGPAQQRRRARSRARRARPRGRRRRPPRPRCAA